MGDRVGLASPPLWGQSTPIEKPRPTYDLDAVKEALGSVATLAMTTTALKNAAALGSSRHGVVALIASMERRIVKSMATFDDHRVSEEVALQLNFGHTPQETNRKHYASMSEADRESILDELCRRVLSDRSGLDLYLAFERGEIPETHQDYRRTEGIYRNNAKHPLLTTPPNEV